mgnify:CR=1 FL=1
MRPKGWQGKTGQEVREDPRGRDRARVNVGGPGAADLGGRCVLMVAVLRFSSLRLVLAVLRDVVEHNGYLVLLVKPQFEIGRARLGKGGVVRSANQRAEVVTEVVAAATTSGLTAMGLCASPIRGTTGNAEYLVWLTPRPDPGLTTAQVTELAATMSTETPT